MAADGDVKPEELEKFDLIGNALLQNYAQIRDSLLQQCEDATSKINENDSRTDAINDLVDKEIETAESSDDDLMDPSLLVWNMLVTANERSRLRRAGNRNCQPCRHISRD